MHRFSLIFRGPEQITDEIENSLYNAGCDDPLVGVQHGEFFIDFAGQALAFRTALISAVSDANCSGPDLELARVEMIDSDEEQPPITDRNEKIEEKPTKKAIAPRERPAVRR